MNLSESLKKSIETGFIDKSTSSDRRYRPKLLVNDKATNSKVLTTLLKELEQCDAFYFSVAFVTTGGIATLINTLIDLEEKQIKGKVLVSQYLNFTQPEALKKLSRFSNIELRIATEGDFHSKAYLFKNDSLYNLIVGSSNLTQTALCSNNELNLRISATINSELVNLAIANFQTNFEAGKFVDEDFIASYSKIYQSQFEQSSISKTVADSQGKSITPNKMQADALLSIASLRAEGKDKALLVSATGTGKTYLSAFDVQRFNPKKFLFIVHRRTIAIEAMNTFQSLLGSEKKMGVYSGAHQELDADYIFSTIQTLSKQEHLEKFRPDQFEYIVIDETHRAGAASYKRIMDYFKPKFMMGMTATPERTDSINIFELFDHNIAYEIRLHQALAENMLSPFHYYGIADLSIDNREIDDLSDFNLLTSSERVTRILDKVSFYGTDSGETRGLVFCSRKNECISLCEKFNEQGYSSIALTGDSSEEERSAAIKRLESPSLSKKLDYIFTVDIFNEGVDIPSVNQIIMLRPTQSAIIFVQQLGRGLRKVESKDYLTVLDFIGNYNNNYLVPIALYGDSSYNKDALRKLISSRSREIPGSSTVNFDKITKEKIFASIDSASMHQRKDLVKDYQLLKFQLGRIPMSMDFIDLGSRDPYLFVKNSKSYFNFVVGQEESLKSQLNENQTKLLELFSVEINNGKRIEESLILKEVIENGACNIIAMKNDILSKYAYTVSDKAIQSCLKNLNFEFVRENKGGELKPVRELYNIDIVKIEGDEITAESKFLNDLVNNEFRRFLMDNIELSICSFNRTYKDSNFVDGFCLYQKYSRKDVFRILCWDENPVAQNVGGYMISGDKSNCALFVNYHKEEDISSSTKYEDRFINQSEFEWMSKSRRSLNSPDVKTIRNIEMRLPLFIKKSNDEGNEFYFMGDIKPVVDSFRETKLKDDNNKEVSVVKVLFSMDTPVDDDVYQYLVH